MCFYDKAKLYHPDSTKDQPEAIREINEEKFKRITAAYEILSNVDKK
jgi:curved DNA-binding protein CbpA